MSEFLAEAKVLVRPDTSKFRTELQAQLLAATKGLKPIAVPVVPISTGRGAAEAAGALTTLNAVSKQTTSSLLGASSASAKLDAALLGLRTAAGSTAVIGLGAVSLAAILAGKAIRNMIVDTAAFQQELSTFRATTGATADEMERVSAAAEKLGADVRLPAVSAADAAIAMTELAKAGLSVEESIAGAAGVLELATAAQLSNAEAAQITANALNSFGLAGDQAVRVADDLANAANAAQGSITDIGIAMQQASAVARQVGLTLEDTTAILSLFAKNGLQGSDAGTSLRVALIRLVAPTQKAAEEIKRLGLQIRDAQGNLRADIFAQFGQATRNLGPAARDAAAALIFGQDAIRAVSIGAREGADGLKLMQFQIDQTGTAAELAAARTEGLAGAFSGLQSNLQTLGIEIGAAVTGPLTATLDIINSAISDVNELATSLKNLGNVKIPVIEIPIKVIFGGGGSGREGQLGLFSSLPEQLKAIGEVIQGTLRGKNLKFGTLQFVDENQIDKVKELEDELKALQKARIEAFQGGDEATADRLTVRINGLKVSIDSLKSSLGTGGTGVEQQIAHLQKAIDLLEGTGSPRAIADLHRQIDNLRAGLQASGAPITDVVSGLGNLDRAGRQAATGLDVATAAAQRLKAEATTLSDQLQKLQAEGASPQSQIANLQAQNAAQNQIIANAEKNGRQAGDITSIRKARAIIIANNAQIKSLMQGIASDAEQAAKDIKDATDRRDQAILDMFGGREARAQNAITRAQATTTLKDDLAAQKTLLTILTNKLVTVQNTVKNAKTKAAALRSLNAQMIAVGQEIARITKAIADATTAAADATRAFQQSHLEAALSIAETTDTKVDDRKALAAIIANDKAQIARILALKKKRKLTLEEKTQLDGYRVDLAQRTKALQDLKAEQKKSNEAASAFFSFLQAQQGFASNLLGNLIPGFATKGLVGGSGGGGGGSAGSGGTVVGNIGDIFAGIDPLTGRPVRESGGPSAGVSSASAVAATRGATVRPVQVDTTNALLRQILAALQGRHTQPPEARYQRHEQRAAFDGVHGG